MDGAFYVVPDAPGLGIDVDEAELAKMPFEYSEPPHLRRTDGSFTNW
jgi:galactonate dehydratase